MVYFAPMSIGTAKAENQAPTLNRYKLVLSPGLGQDQGLSNDKLLIYQSFARPFEFLRTRLRTSNSDVYALFGSNSSLCLSKAILG